MTTPSNPKQDIFLDFLAENLAVAERYLHLSDLLFQPPRALALLMHPYFEGPFKWFEAAATQVVLLAVRRCIDGHPRSMGLHALVKDRLVSKPPFSADLLDRIQTLIDQSLVHSDPESASDDWWKRAAVTRGEAPC